MEIKTVLTCPLGSKCEEVKDGAIHRCAWFVKLAGKDPTSEKLIDEQGCAMSWVPILLIENSQQQKGTAAAVESFRNEMSASNQSTSMLLSMPGHLPQLPR